MSKLKWLVLVTSLFFFQGQWIMAQVPVFGSETILEKLRLNKGANSAEEASYVDVVGDPYLFKEFANGKLILTDGKSFDVSVRLDMYANQIQFKVKNEIFSVIHPENVDKIVTDSLKFIYSKYVKTSGEQSSNDFSYFILRTDGICKLLIKKQIRVQDAVPPQLYQDAKPAKFVALSDTYYLKRNNESAIRIRNEKELLEYLGDQKEALVNFINSNRLKVKDIEDLSKIVSFYNTL